MDAAQQMLIKWALMLTDKIAAGASVAAEIMDSVHLSCTIKCAKPIILIHGTKDNHVPYNGGAIKGQNGGNGKDGYSFSADSSFHLWAERDGCKGNYITENLPNKVKKDNCIVVKETYTNCNGDNNVILYKIINGGHTWPGSNSTIVTQLLLGNTNEDINAGVETWNFFKTRTLQNCNGANKFSAGITSQEQ
ncbi:MAG: hypothetical protein ABJA79_05495 [Parafilimonas sp.]